MADLYFPSVLTVNRAQWRYIDNAARFTALSGISRVYARTGDRWSARLEIPPGDAEHRSNLHAFIAAMQGGANSVLVHDHSYVQRGSFPATELFTNNTFANGTTGWTAQNAVLSASGRTLRVAGSVPGGSSPAAYQTGLAVTQYAPYVLRSVLGNRKGASAALFGPFISSSAGLSDSGYLATPGYSTADLVMNAATTGACFPAVINDADNYLAGDSIDCFWASLARCALVDNGPNLLLQSQDFATTWANTRSTDAANSTAAPDGTTTADSIIEDGTASNTHAISQSVTVASTALDYAYSVSLKAGTRTWAALQLIESTGPTNVTAYINLSTGAVGTTATGANWSNLRTFVVNQGNGWYRLTLVARKTSASTSLSAWLFLAEADNDAVYSGDGASLIYAWGASLAQSSVPVRYTATTTTASTGSNPSGSTVYVKGLPASTSGLLLTGDRVQIGDEYKLVTAPLDSDAAGLGVLHVSPMIRQTHADNAPVIINQPMCRMMFAGSENGWDTNLGPYSTAALDLIEDLRT